MFISFVPNKIPHPSFLLENLVTVSDFHPSFDEADYTLIQECESCFLQQDFSVAQLCMHLLCEREFNVKKKNFTELHFLKNTTHIDILYYKLHQTAFSHIVTVYTQVYSVPLLHFLTCSFY